MTLYLIFGFGILAAIGMIAFRQFLPKLRDRLSTRLKSWMHPESLHDIRANAGVEINGLYFPGMVYVKKSDQDVIYYCHICYVTSEKPGRCQRHGFDNPLTKGTKKSQQWYDEQSHFYEADSDGGYEDA